MACWGNLAGFFIPGNLTIETLQKLYKKPDFSDCIKKGKPEFSESIKKAESYIFLHIHHKKERWSLALGPPLWDNEYLNITLSRAGLVNRIHSSQT